MEIPPSETQKKWRFFHLLVKILDTSNLSFQVTGISTLNYIKNGNDFKHKMHIPVLPDSLSC